MIMLFTACAACRKNRGKIPTTPPPAATGLSSTFDPKQFSMAELEKATHNFSRDLIIGRGSFGSVYKARLPYAGLSTVAVKKLNPDAFQGFREYRAEKEILCKLRHPNIITIHGFCDTGSDRVLVYEYVENGSLDQWLLPGTTPSEMPKTLRSRLHLCWRTRIKIAQTPRSPRPPLSWETRIKIVRGVASGLAYMHNLETPIIHRNIKASKVLLGNDFEPHIADFGFARIIDGSISHLSTGVAGTGTMGYMPPEYMQGTTMATAMGDVYSFGILMLHISTRIRPDKLFMEEGNRKGVRFIEWAREKVAQNLHMEILDANISRAGLEESGVVDFLRIALLCASYSSMDRPPMREVVELLNRIPT